MDITRIDSAFKSVSVEDHEVVFADVLKAPFRLSGFPWRKPDGPLYRLPDHFTEENSSPGLCSLKKHTSGGQLAFRTDSKYIALRADVSEAACDMNHMPRTGSSGFDLFEHRSCGDFYVGACRPVPECLKGKFFEAMLLYNAGPGMHSYRLNLPLYGSVSNFALGFAPGAKIEPPEPFALPDPVLFYGSSITQGGCASRPGNNYCTMLCRKLNLEQINLGFSGNAKGEAIVAEAIAGLRLSLLVYDYDHNAPNPEHLARTHEPFFRIIRNARPELPVLMMTRGDKPDPRCTAIVRATYEHALAAGDRKVRFIDGREFFACLEDPNMGTVDGCHPTDLGFYCMYQRILPVMREILGL